MSVNFSGVRLYVLLTVLVTAWWYFAFGVTQTNSIVSTNTPPKATEKPTYFSYLSPMKREDIQAALAGDEEIMISLMSEWDIDAQILMAHEVNGVQRLSHHDYLNAQMLRRRMKMELSNCISCNVTDDTGISFSTNDTFQSFLPQTYVAASFLLALTDPSQIVALPSGLRENKQLFPYELTQKIPLDIERYNAENLFLSQPDLAFVAHYSNPATIQSLKEQNIPLFTLKYVETISDVIAALKRIGKLANRSSKAELLSIFMESALLAIDNRMLAAHSTLASSNATPRVMFLNYYAQFSVPTTKIMTGQLLRRLKDHYVLYNDTRRENNENWSIPIDQENILAFNPDYLIIATPHGLPLDFQVLKNPAFTNLSAIKGQHVTFVDDVIQNFPTQYIVLAYYDLATALQK